MWNKKRLKILIVLAQKKTTQNDSIISAALNNCILSFISRDDSITEKNINRYKSNIFIVEFSKEANNCYLYIFNHHCYNKADFAGYIIIAGRMIAFYQDKINCLESIVNISSLKKDVPNTFSNCDDNISYFFEPKYAKYKVISKDSIEFVEYGWL